MFLGYNTNGFAHHRLEDAIDILAELGYGGIALTLDVHHLDPFAPDMPSRIAAIARQLARYRMRCAIETGARFLLDPRQKHQPTLLSPTTEERAIRLNFLKRSLTIAADLGADCLSFWSGASVENAPGGVLMVRLEDRCERLAEYATEHNVRLAFEPEPGMFIDSMEKYAELFGRINHPAFGLTVDVGHLACNGELPVSKVLADWQHVLWNVHIEDMHLGIHDHLMFGEGDVDFTDVFVGLRAVNYSGGVYVELSRHSYDAVNAARKAKAFLEEFIH